MHQSLRHGRSPRQARSWARVERILLAAAETLAERGYAGTTTNHIAERAGVHVPSMYQYFENKDAIVAELWDRHVVRTIDTLRRMLGELADAPIAVAAELYVAAELATHAEDPALLSVLYAEGPRQPGALDLGDEAVDVLVPYLESHRDVITPVDLATAARVIVAAVEGVARHAVQHADVDVDALAGETTRLLAAYLGVAA